MQIGIPKEIKPLEGRVALIPAAAAALVKHGHPVCVQAGAGVASGYDDAAYRRAGVEVVPDAAAVYARASLVLKVKEPVAPEYALLRQEHTVFSYLHLATNAELARVLADTGLTALAFETVCTDGALPLLAPMSDIAGRLAVQIGATLLHTPHGGRGVLLGGLPAAERGRVTILGAGEAGGAAAAAAASLGAAVTVFARSRDSLARMHALGANVTALASTREALAAELPATDLLIGAVLIPGGRSPRLVDAAMVRTMRPGSAIVDISVDQGGCIETIRPTDYLDPTYVCEGIVHFGVTNMPGAVPVSATQALSAALVPYVQRLAAAGWEEDPELRSGINVRAGRIVHPAVAAAIE